MTRWAIFIDIEGFSKIYPDDHIRAYRPVHDIMESLYFIGNRFCPESPHRLFAHQIGDGFLIVSEFAERSPEIPIAISVILMRKVTMAGGMAKCTISQGEFADIQGFYPEVIKLNHPGSKSIPLGRGQMHLLSVMGSALINAYRLSGRVRGSVLLIDSELREGIPSGITETKREDEYSVLDWVHADTDEVAEISGAAGIHLARIDDLENSVRKYVNNSPPSVPTDWKTNTLSLNNC